MFGKFNQQGEIEQDVDICVLTGRKVEPGDIMYRIPGTPYFVRVAAAAKKDWTPEAKEALKTLLPPDAHPQPVAVEETPQPAPDVVREFPVIAGDTTSAQPRQSTRRSSSSAAKAEGEE